MLSEMLDRQLIHSVYTDRIRLPECQLRLSIFFRFDARAEELLEETFLHQTFHGSVIDNLTEIEAFDLRARLFVRRMIDYILLRLATM